MSANPLNINPNFSRKSRLYRYSFNGKEKDNESFQGAYDFGARIMDSRLGRWMSVDALFREYTSQSTYCNSANSPIWLSDIDGRKVILSGNKWWTKKDDIVFQAGKPCPENATTFQKEAYEAMTTFIGEDKSGNVALLVASEKKILRIGYGADKTLFGLDLSKRGDNRGFITWDNREGMLCTDVNLADGSQTVYPNDPNAVMSPKQCLKHELQHAIHRLITKTFENEYDDDQFLSDPEMHTREEERAIKEAEIADGINRTNHRGVPIKTASADSKSGEMKHTKKNQKGELIFFNKWKIIVNEGKKPIGMGTIRK